MVKSTILIVAVAAVAVAAGACVYFFAFNGDDKDSDKAEIYRELKEGDKMELDVGMSLEASGKSGETNTESFLEGLYFDGTIEGEKAKVRINSTDYDCTIVEDSRSKEKEEIYVLDSGFRAKYVSYREGKLYSSSEITDTNLDPTKGLDEQVLVKGSYYSMKVILTFAPHGNEIQLDGTFRIEVESVDGTGDIVVKADASISGDGKIAMEVESVVDEKVKFKGIEGTMNMFEAMAAYSYDHLILDLEDDGFTIAYGEKSSEKKKTEFGKREVISQQLKCTSPYYNQTVDCEFGVNNVLYKQSVSADFEFIDGIVLDLLFETTLLSCTAVTTEKV